MEHLIISFLQLPIILGRNILLSALFSYTLFCVLPLGERPYFHTYKTTGTIIVLCTWNMHLNKTG